MSTIHHRRRTDPRTEDERRKISDARAVTAVRMAQESAELAELCFRLLLQKGNATPHEVGVMLGALDRALRSRVLQPGRRRSLELYRRALERGTLKIATHETETHTAPFVSPLAGL